MRNLTFAFVLAVLLLSAPAAHADIVSDFSPAPGKCLNGGFDTMSPEQKAFFMHSATMSMFSVTHAKDGVYVFKNSIPPYTVFAKAGNLEGAKRLLEGFCD